MVRIFSSSSLSSSFFLVNPLPCDRFVCKTGILALANYRYNSQTKKLWYGHPQYFLTVYEKIFLRTPSKYLVMSTCPNMVKHEKIREIVLFRGEGEVIVTGRTTDGGTAGVVRAKYQAKRTIRGDAPRSHSKNPPNFPLSRHATQKCAMQSAVESGIDRCGHARRLQKAQGRLPSDSCF